MAVFLCSLQRGFLVVALLFSPFSLAEERAILVLGDSLSSAYRMQDEQTWPSLMEDRLHQAGQQMRVINLSRSGETSKGGKARLPEALDEHRPAIVILAVGANDGLRKRSLEELKDNLTGMINMVRQSGGTPVLVGMRLPPTFDQNYAQEFSNVFAQVASDTGTHLVPFLLRGVVENPELFLPDRLHPRPEAQPKLLDEVWPVLNATLNTSQTSGSTSAQ